MAPNITTIALTMVASDVPSSLKKCGRPSTKYTSASFDRTWWKSLVSVLAGTRQMAALARLSEAQRAEIAQAEPFRSALRALQHEAGAAEVPTSWATWLARSSSPDFVNALDLARMGADEWSMGGNAADPREVGLLLDGLDAAQADPLAAERTSQALPYLVAALRRDPAFPNSALMPVYSSLLTLLALGSARGAATYGSSLVLVDALLSVGTDRGRYRELIADVDEIAGQGLGVDMAYWTLELVELFMRSAAPDEVERERLVHSILARLAPIGGRLSSFQQAAVRGLAQEFGWSLNAVPIAASASRDDLSTRLTGVNYLPSSGLAAPKDAANIVSARMVVMCCIWAMVFGGMRT